jgi:hypothetical protein
MNLPMVALRAQILPACDWQLINEYRLLSLKIFAQLFTPHPQSAAYTFMFWIPPSSSKKPQQ